MFVLIKSKMKKFFFIVFCSLIIGSFCTTVKAGYDYYKAGNDKGVIYVKDSDIDIEGQIENDNNSYILCKKGGKIEIDFPSEIYIDKLQYHYSTLESQENAATITIYTHNVYGEEMIETVEDYFFSETSRSAIPIKNTVSRITIEISDLNTNLELSGFVIDNAFEINPLIGIFISGCAFLLLFLIVFRRENVQYPPVPIFISILSLGIIFLVLQAPYCTGWDEQIHFSNSYNMAVVPFDQGTPNAVSYLANNAPWLNQHHVCASIEERLDLIEVLNQKGKEYGQPVEEYELQINSIGYIFQALFITVARFLGLPFYIVWILGKFSNVLLYAAGISIAVGLVPVGKRLLMAVSLVPTFLFLCATYTYDITVIVFIVLGICIWIREAVFSEQVFTVKWRVLYFACMIIGCMPKAVYAPLLFCVLTLPLSKFKSPKDQLYFRGLTILCGVFLLSTFVLPTILGASSIQGDPRGGNTSVSEQLKYVLFSPIAYAQVLWKNVTNSFIDFTAGTWLGLFAYIGQFRYPELNFATLIGIALTDTYDYKGKKGYGRRNKIVALLSILFTIVLIWTALYLSFTEVGAIAIAGVQGRYYFPIFFLLFLSLRIEKIRNTISLINYQTTVMFLSIGLALYSIYSVVLIQNCV